MSVNQLLLVPVEVWGELEPQYLFGVWFCHQLVINCASYRDRTVNRDDVQPFNKESMADVCVHPRFHTTYSLFDLRKPRSQLILNGERGFLRMNRLCEICEYTDIFSDEKCFCKGGG